jgi:hypothetical protein
MYFLFKIGFVALFNRYYRFAIQLGNNRFTANKRLFRDGLCFASQVHYVLLSLNQEIRENIDS